MAETTASRSTLARAGIDLEQLVGRRRRGRGVGFERCEVVLEYERRLVQRIVHATGTLIPRTQVTPRVERGSRSGGGLGLAVPRTLRSLR